MHSLCINVMYNYTLEQFIQSYYICYFLLLCILWYNVCMLIGIGVDKYMCKYLLCVLYCYFLNTCHVCIHMHRLIPCSGRSTQYEHRIQSQTLYNIDLFCYTWWYAFAIAYYQHNITLCAWLNIHASRLGVWVLEATKEYQ